ncbi:MAG: NAD(P)H-dependent oxidoreductase [Oscillospiraceae bacterium]|nr:NAD(P)H-dependent oxidoreductase [Oscillospiraceae bacterium]
MKTAVVFYSLSGNTRKAAVEIAEALHADLLEVQTAEEMPKGNFMRMMHGGRLSTFKKCPPIQPLHTDFSAYDSIILGTPVWAWKCAAPIRTLLTEYAVSDKVKAVITLSLGMNDEKCTAELKQMLPNLRYTITLADSKAKEFGKNAEAVSRFLSEWKAENQ